MLDTGNNLVLSVETDRVINLNSSRYFLGVEGDKEVKIIRFQLDRYYCGIDLSVFKPRVNYKLSNSKEYYGEATIADFDEDYIYVEWTLDPSVTSVKGRVDFLVQLTKLDEEGSILKRYNSTMAMGRVEEGLNPEDQLPESMKKDILAIAEDALTQLKESKTEFDNQLKIISDKQNKIIVRLDATDLKINNFDEDYETKMNDFHADYQEKMETFENDYNEKTSSAIKSIKDASTKSVTNVENARDEALENIQNKSTESLNNINEAKNMALKNIENSGEYYQDQINELQQSEALQDEVLDKLNEEVDLKLTQPYLNNKGENHVVNSDNGLMRDLVIKGNTVQVTTKGYQLFYLPDDTIISNGVTTTIKDGLISCEGTAVVNGWFDVSRKLNISLKQGIEYTFSINKALSVRCALKTFEDARGIDRNITIGKTSMQFTPDSDISSAYVWIAAPAGTNIDIQFRVQVEKGSTAHDYEPYTGGQLSPNPDYPQEVKGVDKIEGKIVGKNLFGGMDFANKIVEFGGVLDKENKQVSIRVNDIDDKVVYYFPNTAKNYTVIIKGSNTDKYVNMNVIYETGETVTLGTFNNGYAIYTTRSDLKPISIYGYWRSGTTTFDYEYFGVFEGILTLDDFMEYTSTSISYILSNPLYRLSDSVYDYIDVNRGKIVRNVGVVTFDGSDDELWNLSKTQYTNNIRFYTGILAGTSIKLNLLVLCNKFIYVKDIQLDKSNLSTQDLTGFKAWLNKNPITVVYQLATPVEEPLPSDLQTLLQSLKTYYPQTNIMFDTEVEPYINFDYKLNLKSWIEDKDNKEIEYDKSVNDIQPYSDSYIEKWFNLMRTGRVYTVKFPLWETSQSPIGEKLDANSGLICEPSTPVYAGQNDYDEIPVFKTFDVNAYVDNDGEVHLTAFKGDENFQDTGKVDVFVLTMSYYEKTWTEDGYWYYSISDSPKPGYTIAKECLKKDGSIRPHALYAKYVAGAIDGEPYSSKGLIPCYYPFETISAYHMVSYCKQRGKYYTGGLMWDYKYIWTRFMLKFANTNSQAVLGGVFDYSFQYPITIAEENVKRVIVSKSNATRYVVGSCVSIGDWGEATSMDRSNKNCHNIARNVKILSIEDIDDSNSALNLDLAEPITTTTTCRVTTMHYLSGYSDEILGRDGSLGTDPKSTKHPIVISGIECAVGGYEIPCNAMMNILNASGDREVYITHDATKLSTNTQTIMNTWKKSGMTIKTSKVNNWQYITKMGIDTELGCVLPLAAGESGSGSSTGFGDGLYCDNAATGQREFLLLGSLWTGSVCGLSCLNANSGFSITGWYYLARISIMAVRGE